MAASARAASARWRVLGLPPVAELCDRSRLAARHEDRVVTEPFGTATRLRDLAFETPRRAQLRPIGREQDQLAHVASPPILDTCELAEQPRNAVRRPARRLDARATAERSHLDPRVLARDPRVLRSVPAAVARLDSRVVDERRAVLDRVSRRVQELDLPRGKRASELSELVRVARREDELHTRARATASSWAAVSSSIPPAARSSSSSSSSRENGSRSAVACTSTSAPSPVMTTFMSVSADESST